MAKLPPAEALLQELGVGQPSDIDLEVIAWHLGLKVKYRDLTSCEARIVALGDRGIITIDKRKLPERQRFSLGHEPVTGIITAAGASSADRTRSADGVETRSIRSVWRTPTPRIS